MNGVFQDCIDNFLVVYLDDLLIFSDTREEHMRHLEIVLSRLQEHQSYASASMVHFFRTRLNS